MPVGHRSLKHGDNVRITSGFYRGFDGVLTGWRLVEESVEALRLSFDMEPPTRQVDYYRVMVHDPFSGEHHFVELPWNCLESYGQ